MADLREKKQANYRGRGISLLELRKIANELKTNTSLEILNFSNNPLGTIGVKTLVNGLIKNTTVQALLLNECQLTNEIVEAIAVLIEHGSIRRIDLAGNSISAIKGLAKVIKETTSLTYLNLYDNPLGNSGAIFLATCGNRSLVELNLSKTGLTDKCIDAVSSYVKASPTLKKLYLHHNRIGSPGGTQIIEAGRDTLSTLNLSYNHIGTEVTDSLICRSSPIFGLDVSYQSAALHAEDDLPHTKENYHVFPLPDVSDDWAHSEIQLANVQLEIANLRQQLQEAKVKNAELVKKIEILKLGQQPQQILSAQIDALEKENGREKIALFAKQDELDSLNAEIRNLNTSLLALTMVIAQFEGPVRQYGDDHDIRDMLAQFSEAIGRKQKVWEFLQKTNANIAVKNQFVQ